MMKPPNEEECEGGVTDGVDRLSNLPDSLLCHIMSFLPTRTSVATISLVSPRYLHYSLTLFSPSANPVTFKSSISLSHLIDTNPSILRSFKLNVLKLGSLLQLDPTFKNSFSQFLVIV